MRLLRASVDRTELVAAAGAASLARIAAAQDDEALGIQRFPEG
jgi:hypothetical protein